MPDESDAYYGGGSPAPDDAAPAPNKGTQPDDTPDQPATALLPKSIFGDKIPEVGETCQFTVEHIWEKEVEVSYTKDGDQKQPGKKPSLMDEATSAFDNVSSPEPAEG